MAKAVALDFKCISKFVPVLNDDVQEIKSGKNTYILCSGRVGGKTITLEQKILINCLQYPKLDIMILRANSSALKDSVLLEFKKMLIKTLPLELYSKFKFKETPPMVIDCPFGNQIRFSGVGLGSKSGSNQSRGKTAERKLSLIIVEETQEIFQGTGSADLLNHAMATYMRLLDDDCGKVIYAGNRDRNRLGKFNQWVEDMKKDEMVTVVESSYLDIKHFLNRATLQLIAREFELNPNNAKYMYLGIPVGDSDLVYGAFTETKHVIPLKDENIPDVFIDTRTHKEFKFDDQFCLTNVQRVYIGVDGSNSRDMTALIPIFHLKDRRLIVKCGNIFQHNPKTNGIIRNNVLAKEHIRKWLQNLIYKYSLQYTEKIFVVDGHNIDLIEQLEYEFGGYCRIVKFTRKDLVETSEKVNNALVDEVLMFTEESWNEIISNAVIPPVELFRELTTVCWREDDPTKFNESIPNDRTDGIRYPVAYHANPYQLADLNDKGSE
jgi:hypothetical protein